MKLKSFIKSLILPTGYSQRRILGGIAAGLVMELDLQNQTQRLLGLDEREIADYVWKLMGKCKSLVDVGANDGYYTLIFLRSSAQYVVACEPGTVIDRLLSNAAANGFVTNDRFSVTRQLIGSGENEVSIPALIHKLPGPIFIKVDIDGGEVSLLQSCEGSSRLAELHWLVETHSVALENQCIEWFQQNGYRAQIIDNAWWRFLLPELRPSEQNRWLVAEPELKVTFSDAGRSSTLSIQ